MAERRVALVKSAGRADAFAQAVASVGCTPVLVSPFRDERVDVDDEELARVAILLAGGGWVAVTSPHAVPALADWAAGRVGPRTLADALRADDPKSAAARIAAVGTGTASALHAAGFRPAVVGDAGGAALARRLREAAVGSGDAVVHPCGEDSRRELQDGLTEAGVAVFPVPVYRMVPDRVGERAATGEFAAVVVGSPRLAARAAELFPPPRPPSVAIGRTTGSALRDLGWPPAAVAARPGPADVAAALRSVLGGPTD